MQCACVVLYCHLSLLYFSTLPYKRHDFRKKLLNIKCVFDFLYDLCPKISHLKKNSTSVVNVQTSSLSVCYPFQMLIKIGSSQEIVEKYSNIMFYENPCSGSRVPCGRTDGQAGVMTLIVTYGILARALSKVKWLFR